MSLPYNGAARGNTSNSSNFSYYEQLPTMTWNCSGMLFHSLAMKNTTNSDNTLHLFQLIVVEVTLIVPMASYRWR
jgi:hypothetical protein